MSVIEMNRVEVSYPRKKQARFYALRELSIEVKQGEIFCLLGPNGSGKTTCVNLINGLGGPTGGDIRVFGMNPQKDARLVRNRLAVVPQETALYNDLTARENLLFHAQYYGLPKAEWQPSIAKMLDLVGLTDRQKDRVGTFSGGMQRRLALARALLTSPDLILLDEPTLGVDVQSRNSIWNQIKALASEEGRTIFLTTNYMEEADQLADRIVIIDKGVISAAGSPEQLKTGMMNLELELCFAAPEQASRMAGGASERRLPAVFSVKDNKAVAQVPNKSVALELLQAFPAVQHGIVSFQLKEPTLNDVFLHYTGRNLRNS